MHLSGDPLFADFDAEYRLSELLDASVVRGKDAVTTRLPCPKTGVEYRIIKTFTMPFFRKKAIAIAQRGYRELWDRMHVGMNACGPAWMHVPNHGTTFHFKTSHDSTHL